MSGLHEQPQHATNLTAEEREGLIPAHIVTREELNEAELQNILEADSWAFGRKRRLTDETFAKSLHRRMYGRVWTWAGNYRTTGKNIGVDANLIQHRLYETMDQFRYWIDNGTFSSDEVAVRFHLALVWIHPFPNGNGRWSRLVADLLAVQLNRPRLSWGRGALSAQGDVRDTYMAALQTADNHDLAPLIAFARS